MNEEHQWETDGRRLTVGEAVSAIAYYCRLMGEHSKEPKFSDLPRVLGLRAATVAPAADALERSNPRQARPTGETFDPVTAHEQAMDVYPGVMDALAGPHLRLGKGMVVVPREPTEAMLYEGVMAMGCDFVHNAAAVWSAMLAAAPPPERVQPVGEVEGALVQRPIAPNSDLALWLNRVASGEWNWVRNTRCKYVTLKIDTRRGAYAILDRDDKPLTASDLMWQYSSETPSLAALSNPVVSGEREAETCRRCGHDNPAWSAPSPLWNAVMRGGSIDGEPIYEDMVCAACFISIAKEKGIASGFRLSADDVTASLETTTPSGRVWDDSSQLWREPAALNAPTSGERG
jgi:hypothetical protein